MRKKKRVLKKYTELGHIICDATGLTQTKLSKKWKISQQTCSKRLRGESAITMKDLAVLAKRCKLKIDLGINGTVVVL